MKRQVYTSSEGAHSNATLVLWIQGLLAQSLPTFAGIDFFIVAEVTDGGCPTLIHSILKERIFNLKANTVQIKMYKIIQ